MTTFDTEVALAAANPLPDHACGCLALGAAEGAMLERICATPAREVLRPARDRRRGPRRRWFLAVGAAALAATAALAALPASHRDDGGPAPAFAASLVRFANASPLVLPEAPGWRVTYADEESGHEGEMHFQHGSATSQLTWSTFSLSALVKDRAYGATARSTAAVLGTTAQLFQEPGAQPSVYGFSAIWRDRDGRVLEYATSGPDMATFKRLLGELRRVDATTWLRALPASVVTTADRSTAVRRMLAGIPLPPGFTVSQVRGSDLVRDRYQLGVAVSGTVACEWFALWYRARQTGDRRAADQAIAAMATAKHWPVLRQMATDGAYGGGIVGYAAAMRSGQPPPAIVDAGLECRTLGVKLRAP